MKESGYQAEKRKMKRFEEIVKVFTKYGFAGYVKEDTPSWITKWFVRPDGELITQYSEPERLRMALTDLGTTFIKFGQMLSLREDIIGPEYAKELTKLQQNTPPDPPERVLSVLETELGKPADEVFADFNAIPLGSASIGQVHAATLHSGESVVVKLLHYGVEDLVQIDLELMMDLAETVEKHGDVVGSKPTLVVREFQRTLLREVNLQNELNNLQRFIRNFAEETTVKFPTPYPDYCSQRVLTMERLDGIQLSDMQALQDNNLDPGQIVRDGANIWMEMIFRDNFFHVDPHPGNLLMLPGGRLGILDCGMTGTLDSRTRVNIEDLLIAYVSKDTDSISNTIIRMCEVPPGFNRDEFSMDVERFMSEFLDVPADEVDVVAMGDMMVDLAYRYQLLMPASVSTLVRTLGVMSGTIQLLDPSFELSELIQPYIIKIVQRRYSPKAMLLGAFRSYKDWERFFTALPGELNNVIDKVQKDDFRVEFTIRNLDKVVNRLIYGLIVAALIMASSILWSAGVGPFVGDISILGIIGIVIAVGLVLKLLSSIEKSGGL